MTDLPARGRRVQLKDVAEQAGVSVAAASRVLSGDASLRISDSKRQQVIRAAAELSYSPAHAARALRTAKSYAIGLMVPEVNSAIFAEVSRGAESAAAELNLTVLLASANQMSERDDWVQRVVSQGRVDGLVLQPSDDLTEIAMNEVLKRRMPLVLMNSLAAGAVSTVRLDDEAAVGVALNHLFDRGHTRIGLLNGHPSNETAKRRLGGFLQYHEARGIATRSDWITHFGYTGPQGRQGIEAIFGLRETPSAIVVSNVNSAMGAISQAHHRKLRLPEDLSIVAIHDVWYADSLWPPLTTVRTPLFEMGYAAVRALMREISGSDAKHEVISSPAPVLVERLSTARLLR